jgi:flavin-dependent dehydrogenase
MDRHYDVVIVGAGPAGASAAAVCRAAGLATLVCDKASLPRMKLCAGGITPEAYEFVLDNFGQPPEHVFATPRTWRGLRMKFGQQGPPGDFVELNRHRRASPYSAAHPEVPTRTTSIWRDRLDGWLVGQSGADVRDNCRLINLENDEHGGVIAHLLEDHHASPDRIHCSYLIGADGATSKTRRLLHPSFDSTASWFAIYEEWYEGSVDLDADWYYVFLDNAFSDVFTSLYSKDQYLVYTSVSGAGGNAKQGYQAFVEYQQRCYGLTRARVCRSWGCLVNNMGATANFAFGSGRVLLVGEAGGFIGFCGEGISGGLISGRLAAEAVLRHFEDPASVVETYRRDTLPLRQRIHKEHELGASLPGGVYGVYTGACR